MSTNVTAGETTGTNAAAGESLLSRVAARVANFFFAPASPRPLGALRIGVAIVLLGQVWLLRTSVLDFFAGDGLIQGELAQELSAPGTPRISWIVKHLASLRIAEPNVIYGLGALYVLALVLMGLGVFSRAAIIAAWFLHWLFMNTGESTSYGVDLYAHVFLFYLMWAPAGDAFSILPGRRGAGRPSSGARLALRVMQIHLALTYLCSSIEKSMGEQWWNGELMWRSLTLPEYAQYDFTWLAWWPKLSLAMGVGSLMLEMGYIIFIWPRRTRYLWAAGIASMHLGIAMFLGLGCFGVFMSLLTPCLFVLSAEP